jgi:N-acetyl-anhydromuramyl-L-alanine amidase AmpD
MFIDNETYPAPEGQYFRKEYEKKHIVVHYTVGSSARSALNWWHSTKNREGVAYVVDRDGQIYQYFDPHYWAYHIFRHKRGERPIKRTLEHSSVGIELVSMGVLKRDGEYLIDPYEQQYCHIEDEDKYVRDFWRGTTYWASYTDEQYESCRDLITMLGREFAIDPKRPPLDDRNEVWTLKHLLGWEGVLGHQNYRKDKRDPGRALAWERLGLVREP